MFWTTFFADHNFFLPKSFFLSNTFRLKVVGHGLFLDHKFVGPCFLLLKKTTTITTTTTTTLMGFDAIEINLVLL